MTGRPVSQLGCDLWVASCACVLAEQGGGAGSIVGSSIVVRRSEARLSHNALSPQARKTGLLTCRAQPYRGMHLLLTCRKVHQLMIQTHADAVAVMHVHLTYL